MDNFVCCCLQIKKNSYFCPSICGSSSVGRARPCQGRGRGFESRLPLKQKEATHFLFFMCYIVYILYSPSTDTFYKGQTSDLSERLNRHNNLSEKATRYGAPWKLIWSSSKPSRAEAMKLEKKLKNLPRVRLLDFINKYKERIAGPDDPD
jgi:putative endonuclease